MAGHGHGGGCSHEHDHDVPDSERGNMFSLYMKIDTDKVECLNEVLDGSGKGVFKPWDQRLDFDKFVESDADEELLFNIPFTGHVKLKGIIVIGGTDDDHPAHMKLFKNRPHMSFDDVGVTADQEFEMHPDREGTLEYNTKVTKFNSVYHLSIHFSRNFGADTTKVYYIGLRGDYSEAPRNEVILTTYEARANPSDHKTNTFDGVGREIH